MTVCNMSIEAGARAGLIGVDDTTLDFIRERPLTPTAKCGMTLVLLAHLNIRMRMPFLTALKSWMLRNQAASVLGHFT